MLGSGHLLVHYKNKFFVPILAALPWLGSREDGVGVISLLKTSVVSLAGLWNDVVHLLRAGGDHHPA